MKPDLLEGLNGIVMTLTAVSIAGILAHLRLRYLILSSFLDLFFLRSRRFLPCCWEIYIYIYIYFNHRDIVGIQHNKCL